MDPDEHVACSDCERIRPGLIAQPVNTVSSLAYVVAGVVIARRARREGGDIEGRRLLLAAAAVAAGLGSVAYHGPGGRWGKYSHDGALAVLFAAQAARHGGPRRPRPEAAALTLGASALHALSRTGRPLCRPDSLLQGHALWHCVSALALVLNDRQQTEPAVVVRAMRR
jgi:hypothetical protein